MVVLAPLETISTFFSYGLIAQLEQKYINYLYVYHKLHAPNIEKARKIGLFLNYNAAQNKLTKVYARIDSVKKSPHKPRKTCLSALLDNPNVNNRTVQRYAGHSDITTTLRYYDFDRSSKEEQARAINEALALEYDEE